MPTIPSPRLDDRTFDEIRRELIRRIPVHAPEWTDHNATDPGIAILELFAWLTENTLYRLNRVPDKALVEFLRLLQVSPRAAVPARALVRLDPTAKDGRPVLVEQSPLLPRPLAWAGDVPFQLVGEATILPVQAWPCLKLPGPPSAETEGAADLYDLLDAVEVSLPEGEELATYLTETFGEVPPAGLPAAVEVGAAIDRALWVALLSHEVLTEPSPGPGDDPDQLRRDWQDGLRAGMSGQVMQLGVRVDDELCGSGDHLVCPDPGTRTRPPRVTWEIATGRFVPRADGRPDLLRPVYSRLVVEEDGTDGLTRSGVVRLRLPAAGSGGVAAFGTWLRADLEDPDLMGIGSLPPLLPDDELEGRVLSWLRVRRAEAPHPRLRWVDVNVLAATQAVTAAPERLGFGNDRPGQRVKLANVPVLAETLVLELSEGGRSLAWHRVDDLGVSRPEDPHYLLEATTGEIRFGDGVHGRMPRPGEEIVARSYQHGGGMRGNVPAGAISRLTRAPRDLAATNPLAAEGGEDSETTEQAKARIPQVLRHRDRAVAAADFRDLALETPGARIGRAQVLPRHKPFERVDDVPGVVTLIVVPAYDPLHPDEPVPDRDQLRRVCEWLEPRRLVTTELYVTPPEYVPLWVSIAIRVQPGYGAATVQRWVDLAIRQHLAPLAPYGPTGEGWPFGRPITLADIESAALRAEGVDLVEGLQVRGVPRGLAGPLAAVDLERCSTATEIPLQAWQLPVVRGVQVVEGASPDPIVQTDEDAAPAAGGGLPVPVELETC